MRNLIAACMASAMCLTAAPALAQSVTDNEANAMLEKMSTPAFEFCTNTETSDSRPPIDQYNACQTALTELAEARRKNPKATPGQNEVYGFFESATEMGNTYAMMRVDGKPTARVCGNIEKQWVLANRSNPGVVGPELANALTGMKEAIRPLVKLCRENVATPDNALPI